MSTFHLKHRLVFFKSSFFLFFFFRCWRKFTTDALQLLSVSSLRLSGAVNTWAWQTCSVSRWLNGFWINNALSLSFPLYLLFRLQLRARTPRSDSLAALRQRPVRVEKSWTGCKRCFSTCSSSSAVTGKTKLLMNILSSFNEYISYFLIDGKFGRLLIYDSCRLRGLPVRPMKNKSEEEEKGEAHGCWQTLRPCKDRCLHISAEDLWTPSLLITMEPISAWHFYPAAKDFTSLQRRGLTVVDSWL